MGKKTWSGGQTIPRIVLGTFNIKDSNTMREMVQAALSCGVYGFDTSPSYGSEELLGQALADTAVDRTKIFLSDKIDGIQMCMSDGNIEKYVDASLQKLGTEYLDLLLVHWPFEKYLLKTWISMNELRRKGKVRFIGLCNIDERKYRLIKDVVDIALPEVIQIELSPLRTAIQDVTFFQSMGMTVEAYSPMCRMIPKIRNHPVLQEIASAHNRTISQVILRWHVERGVIPVFTSTKKERIKENTGIFDFSLEESDMRSIEQMNENYKLFPESFGCPGY